LTSLSASISIISTLRSTPLINSQAPPGVKRFHAGRQQMALIDTVPTTRVVLPSVVQGHENGKLPAALLRNFDGRGALLEIVSYGMQALHLQAWADRIDGFGGIDTETVGRYRTYAQQETLFRSRYTTTVLAGRPSKIWNGVRWYQKPGTAMAAVPGTSNHGWASADDVAEERTGDTTPDPMSDRQLAWMRDNAPSFGFGLESRLERWHWHWTAGDALPARAITVLRYCRIAIPTHLAPADPPPPPPEEDEMELFTLRPVPAPLYARTGHVVTHVSAEQWAAMGHPSPERIMPTDEAQRYTFVGTLTDDGDVWGRVA
jgi:hypothetical protein